MEQCTQSETRRGKKSGMGEGEVDDGWEKNQYRLRYIQVIKK